MRTKFIARDCFLLPFGATLYVFRSICEIFSNQYFIPVIFTAKQNLTQAQLCNINIEFDIEMILRL